MTSMHKEKGPLPHAVKPHKQTPIFSCCGTLQHSAACYGMPLTIGTCPGKGLERTRREAPLTDSLCISITRSALALAAALACTCSCRMEEYCKETGHGRGCACV